MPAPNGLELSRSAAGRRFLTHDIDFARRYPSRLGESGRTIFTLAHPGGQDTITFRPPAESASASCSATPNSCAGCRTVGPPPAPADLDACAAAADRTPAQARHTSQGGRAGFPLPHHDAPYFPCAGIGAISEVTRNRQATAQADPARPIDMAGKTFMRRLRRRRSARGKCRLRTKHGAGRDVLGDGSGVSARSSAAAAPPNGLELCCPAGRAWSLRVLTHRLARRYQVSARQPGQHQRVVRRQGASRNADLALVVPLALGGVPVEVPR